MVNVLVADNNIYYARTLLNYIVSRNDELRVVNISINREEVIENLRSMKIDILILDLKMPVLSLIKLLNRIQVLNLDISIIVVSDDNALKKCIVNSKKIEGVINKSDGFEKINRKINKIVAQKNNKFNSELVKKKILNELLSLGYNIKYNGTKYLAEVISLVYEINDKNNRNGYTMNLEQHFYKTVADKYSKNVENIKVNIINATESMYVECERKKLQDYFSFSYDHKPTPKIVIYTILSKIV